MGLAVNLEQQIINVEGYGKVAKNGNGYDVIVGAVDVFNTSGDYYEYNGKVRKLFDQNGPTIARVKSGEMTFEDNHPVYQRGMDEAAWLNRLLTIEEDRECGKITALSLDEEQTFIPAMRRHVYLIRATIEPFGKLGANLELSLNDKDSDTAFSIRSFSDIRQVAGVKYNSLKLIVCFDRVKAPGIRVAKKTSWRDLGITLESEAASMEISHEAIARVINASEATNESSNILAKELLNISTGCDDNSCIYNGW